MPAETDIRNAVTAALRAAADPDRAPHQQAYMKSEMPFLGVAVPQCRRIAARTAASPACAGAKGSSTWSACDVDARPFRAPAATAQHGQPIQNPLRWETPSTFLQAAQKYT